jgi:hypothetical protein
MEMKTGVKDLKCIDARPAMRRILRPLYEMDYGDCT